MVDAEVPVMAALIKVVFALVECAFDVELWAKMGLLKRKRDIEGEGNSYYFTSFSFEASH